ncbi:uncharacterized protein LOC117123272 isoform X2 [Anneissia japonica]|uniref:uncharacterized protein LOC117123272 isoform X2 n=1 Tax=Anneissia japonica TaxID=1529436 RepID=UPI001425899D|nr:uncharacterized protein LOC117123272 isoform X2 [Anneissia japonica]
MNISGNILSSVVQTRSIERVLAPIAAQVSQLIILNESAKETPESLPNLNPHAQSVLKATEELVQVGQRLAKDSKDEELRISMPKACEAMESAGQSMMVASQCLQIRPHDSQARESLVKAARDVLECTMKVMLISDDAEVRKIVRAAHWAIDRLNLLKSVETMKALVESFKGFTEAVMLLSSLCDKRQQDLTQQQPKQRLLVAMATLKKATPMLSSTMQTFVKYSKSTQAKASCDYVIKHIMVAVTEIINVVEKVGSQKPVKNEEPGHFAIKIDMAMKELSPERRYSLSVDFDCLLESIVRHSMAVASSIPRDHLREGIINSCKEILRQRTIIQEECINVQDNPGFKQLKADYDENCEAFARDFLILEKLVKNALIGQVVDAFVETIEPLERLIKAATVPLKEKGRLNEKVCLEILQPLETAFLSHLDRVCQVGTFMAASCSDHKRVEVIQAAVNTMEQIDPEVLPACLAVRHDILDKRAIQHIKLIHREWKNEVTQLVDTIDELIDQNRFLDVTEAYIKRDITQCREASSITDKDLLADAANCMLGRAKRVIQVAMREVDRSQDPVYRNGLLVFVNQLQKVIPLVKAAANHALEHMNHQSAHEQLAEKAKELLECVEDVHEGLDPRSHPNILSPLRNNVRDPKNSKALHSPVAPVLRKPIQHNESYLSNPLPACSGIVDIQQLSMVDLVPSGEASGTSRIVHDMSSMNLSAKTRAEASYTLMPKNLRYPMIELMTAVYRMDGMQVEACNVIVMKHSKSVADLAKRLAESLRDTGKQRNLKAQADGLLEFTPQVMGTAKASVLKQDVFKAEAQIMVEDWTEKVNDLVKSIIEASIVWFNVVTMVMEYAKVGDNKKLNYQLKQLDSHMQLVRQTVTSTVETCHALDRTHAIRPSSYSTQAQVIQTHASELSRLVKTLSAAASEVSIAEGDICLESQLELLILEWSVKHLQLFQAIDSVNLQSIVMVPSLEEAVCTGSQELVEKEAGNLKKACDSLVQMAKKAILGLKDTMKVEETTVAMSDVEKLSALLMEVVLQRHSNEDGGRSDPIHPRVQLMQRQLQAKVAQLGLLIDESVSDMGLVIDTLTGLALAARQATGPSQTQLLTQFQTLAENLSQNVSHARQVCSRALLPVTDKAGKELAFLSVDRMCRLTPTVISEARDLADDVPGSMERLTTVKREWAANATAVLYAVTKLPEADSASVAEIATALKDLQMIHHLTPQSVPMMMTTPPAIKQTPGGPYQHNSSSSMSAWQPEFQAFSEQASQLYSPSSSKFQMETVKKPALNPRASSHTKLDRNLNTSPLRMRENRGGSLSPVKLKNFGQGTKGPYRTRHVHYSEDASEPLLQHASSSPDLQNVSHNLSSHHTASTPTSFFNNPIAAAALELQQEADRWEEDNNAIVQVAKTMSKQMYQLAQLAKRKTSVEGKEDLCKLSKAIAANGKVIVQFAEIIAKNCVDKRFSNELLMCAEQIPLLSTQLNIISSVKQATPDDVSANATLSNNAENLMQAVMSTLKAAEGACVKGLKPELEGSKEEAEAKALAMQWKRKLHRYRMIEASSTDTDAFGLRRIRKHISAPTLTEILK